MAIRIQDLYTFHVVARCGAMQDAAHELGVTPGAISQRIRAVEERHGLRLFNRNKSGITLTSAGAALQKDTSAAFSKIETAHIQHFSEHQTVIRISASATFAHSMLVSSLGKFSARHPKINVSIETTDRLVDLHSEPIDLAIRHGLGDYPNMVSEWLCSPELLLVGSPSLFEGGASLNDPADCLHHTLLPDATGKDWSLWLRAQGIDDSGAHYGTMFNDDFLTVKAALQGQGLALLNDVYVREALASGALVRALDMSWPTQFAYYAVALGRTLERPIIKALISCLKDDMDTDAA